MTTYELTYAMLSGDAAVAHVNCGVVFVDGPYTTFALDSGEPVLSLPHSRVLEIVNVEHMDRVVPVGGGEVMLGQGDGGKFAL